MNSRIGDCAGDERGNVPRHHGRGQLDRFDEKIKLAIQTVGLDHVEFPRQRSGFLHCKTNAIGSRGVDRAGNHDDGCQDEMQHRTHGATMP